VAALAVIGLLLPRTSHVQRSIEIGRPASVVYAIVDSFQLFDQWSPWQDLDPNMKQTVGGGREGVGATLTWTGNDKVGSGSQVITADVPNRSVESNVDFGSMGVAKATLRLEPVAAGTRVTWMLDSDMGAGPIGHYFGLMMDRMIGQDYAHGLEKLKRLAENMPDVDIAGFDVHAVQVAGRPILMVRRSTGADVSSIAKAYADGYAEIRTFMTARKLKQAGPPMGIDGDMRDKSFTFDAALPVDLRRSFRRGRGRRAARTKLHRQRLAHGAPRAVRHPGPNLRQNACLHDGPWIWRQRPEFLDLHR
jgi:hypothetical protein